MRNWLMISCKEKGVLPKYIFTYLLKLKMRFCTPHPHSTWEGKDSRFGFQYKIGRTSSFCGTSAGPDPGTGLGLESPSQLLLPPPAPPSQPASCFICISYSYWPLPPLPCTTSSPTTYSMPLPPPCHCLPSIVAQAWGTEHMLPLAHPDRQQ